MKMWAFIKPDKNHKMCTACETAQIQSFYRCRYCNIMVCVHVSLPRHNDSRWCYDCVDAEYLLRKINA